MKFTLYSRHDKLHEVLNMTTITFTAIHTIVMRRRIERAPSPPNIAFLRGC